MKKIAGLLTIVLSALSVVSCDENKGKAQEESPVVLYQGAVELSDKRFGLYYGDKYSNEVGVYYVVLSDAMCYRNGYGNNPYMDSEGDMLVLEFHGPVAADDSKPRLPDGTYTIGEPQTGGFRINPDKSYVQKFSNNMQSRYSLKSGSFVVASGESGYNIYTEDLEIVKGKERINVKYSYDGDILLEDYILVAPGQVGLKEDVIDVPFYEAEGGYYGNLYGCGTANYMITLSTKGFSDDDTNTLPGMMLVLNLFDTLPKGDNKVIAINPGTYTVQTYMDASVGSMFHGLSMSTDSGNSPFGTFFYQITSNQIQSVEFIDSGSIVLDRDDDDDGDGDYKYVIEYDLKSSAAGRSYKGTWIGEIPMGDLSNDAKRLVLSTLEDDVECDMSKVESASLQKVETLKSSLDTPSDPSFELATVWQVHLQPRDWTAEEKKNYEWDERLDVWTPDGDCMVFEFILPVRSYGEIAPSPEHEYVYTIQPDCAIDGDDYTMCVSQMGRPYDDLFHPETAKYWGFANYSWFPKEFDYCNSRRGFTWDGWFRGVWYYHLKDGKYYEMDENAPAVKGTVKVYRKGNIYKFTWDLQDDAESPNKITGTWEGQLKRVVDVKSNN